MTLRDVDRIEGEEHGVHLCIQGMPSMACAQGHRRLVAPTFASEMLDTLLADPKLVPLEPAGRRGLLRKRFSCPGCGAVLDGGASGRVESHRTIAVGGQHAFDVQLEMPTFRCPACQRECVEPVDVVAADLMKASARAFRTAQLAVA
jgi:hypothetical protein